MLPTIILLVIAIAAVAAVIWYNRRHPAPPVDQQMDQDTAWNDPTTPRAPNTRPAPDDRP